MKFDFCDFLEMAAAMDVAVGLIVDKLKEVKMWNNSLFVFLSDNGGQVLYGGSNWPLRGNKNTLYEGGTRVPAFVAGPVLKKTGYNSSSIIHAVDWFPTLLSATGVKSAAADIDGVDQWPLIRDGTGDAPRSEFIYNLDRKDNKLHGAIRQGDLKLILRPSKGYSDWYAESEEQPQPVEAVGNAPISVLYNITADPNEEEDLFATMKAEAKLLGSKLRAETSNMIPSRHLEDVAEGDPSRRDPAGTYGPAHHLLQCEHSNPALQAAATDADPNLLSEAWDAAISKLDMVDQCQLVARARHAVQDRGFLE
ncbi:arylsulfatase I [Rhipicephalus sanguineus]|uniref:arylsulfatase I n=1 Tax=Rhipicephalus sanguineus TaxID=34632 RepID=UPI0018943DBE|nr:arylsulfatase I [Rhipicephalus sanguineus]